MSLEGHIEADTETRRQSPYAVAVEHWPLVVGFLVLAIPTLIRLAREVWPTELGAHGPIVLATGVWLIYHVKDEMLALKSRPPRLLAAGGFLAGLGLYVFGRPYDLLAVEALGLYIFFISTAVMLLGLRAIMSNLFPFFYLGFLVPPPGWLIDRLTAPLQMFVSTVSTKFLSFLGYPIDRQGIVIMIDRYKLLVEDACAGMNSLIGLTAVVLFYIYIIHRSSIRYSFGLALAIVPIAVFVNIIRVCALILLTYYAGDAVAQGFLHVTTGVVLFAFALGFTILLDKFLQTFLVGRFRASEMGHG